MSSSTTNIACVRSVVCAAVQQRMAPRSHDHRRKAVSASRRPDDRPRALMVCTKSCRMSAMTQPMARGHARVAGHDGARQSDIVDHGACVQRAATAKGHEGKAFGVKSAFDADQADGAGHACVGDPSGSPRLRPRRSAGSERRRPHACRWLREAAVNVQACQLATNGVVRDRSGPAPHWRRSPSVVCCQGHKRQGPGWSQRFRGRC